MTAAYTVELIALAIWIGGLIVIVASVIPAVFNSFGMEPGGRFLTRVFEGYNRLILVAGAVLLAALIGRHFMNQAGASGGPSRAEVLLTLLMISIAGLIMFVLEPNSVKLQEEAFAVKEEAARKAAYAAFFKSHNIVRALYVVNLVFAVALIPTKLNHWMNSIKAGS